MSTKSQKMADKAFEFLVPGLEIYGGQNYTWLSPYMEWEFKQWALKCDVCGKPIEVPYRRVTARKPGTKWTGQRNLYICAEDYTKYTGKMLRVKKPARRQ